MKIKYADTQVTFKISLDEWNLLLEQKELHTDYAFPNGQKIKHKIASSSKTAVAIDSNIKGCTVALSVTPKDLEVLKTPSKSGVVSSFTRENSEYFFSIEVDMKSRR